MSGYSHLLPWESGTGCGDLSEETVLVQARPPACVFCWGSSLHVQSWHGTWHPQRRPGHTEGGLMTEGRGARGCLDPGLKIERQTQAWGPRRSQGGRPGWGSAWASLGSLPKYGRFSCLHLSHAGHGPRDLLSRYCKQDCASPAGPTHSPSWLCRHLHSSCSVEPVSQRRGAIH